MPNSAGPAVFLSYASQDAAAVERIAEALRAAGVEVWFDKNELVGGDAWDQKIRRQIKECALFVPVISANTNARAEGYFRLEWKLAVDRSHLMSDDHPFLFPVVIDDTADAAARVPDRFRDVQWTRLNVKDTPESLATRVAKILGGGSESPADIARAARHTDDAAAKKSSPAWLRHAWAIFGLLMGFFWVIRPLWNSGVPREKTPPAAATSATPAKAPAPQTKAQQLVAQARALYEPWDFASADDFKLAEQLLKQATELEPSNADAWAALAIEATGQSFFGYDRTDARDALLRTAAERAAKLAPDSDFAKLALGLRYRRGPGTDDEALRVLSDLETRHGTDKFILRQLASALGAKNRDEEALATYARADALPGGDAIALCGQERIFERLHRLDEAEAAVDRALTLRPDYGFAHIVKIVLLFYERGDIERVKQALRQVPARVMTDERVASVAAFIWYFAHDADQASDALRYVSHDYIESNVVTAPKGLITGLVHRLAGRDEAAAIEWREALRVLEQRIAANPTAAGNIGDKAMLLALLGERAAAEAALRTYEQLTRVTPGRARGNTFSIYAELGQADAVADYFTERLKAGEGGSPAAIFKFQPSLDRFRDLPRFKALALEADRVFAANAARAAKLAPAGKSTAADKPASAADKSVAVLAFANLSDDKGNEYFSDGISEELLNVLGRVPGLRVAAPMSAFSFKAKNVSAQEIGQKLNVAYLVNGSVRRAGTTVVVVARLNRVDTDEQIWSEKFSGETKDVFALQEEIAGKIAKSLSLKLGASSAAATASVNPQAFELYLQGRAAWNRRTRDGYDRAEVLFTKAVEVDANFARAYSGLADVYDLRAVDDGDIGRWPQRNAAVFGKMHAILERAMTLDPLLADAHASLGDAFFDEWKPVEAIKALRRSVELNPNYATGWHWLGEVLLDRGEMDEALACLRRAVELDPFSLAIAVEYSRCCRVAGRTSDALEFSGRALNLHPDAPRALSSHALALIDLGRTAEALPLLRTLLQTDAGREQWQTGMAVVRAGLTSEGDELLARFRRDGRIHLIAPMLAARGNKEAFFEVWQQFPMVTSEPWYLWEPFVDDFRKDPRFFRVLEQTGLTEAHARAQAWRAAHPAEKAAAKK